MSDLNILLSARFLGVLLGPLTQPDIEIMRGIQFVENRTGGGWHGSWCLSVIVLCCLLRQNDIWTSAPVGWGRKIRARQWGHNFAGWKQGWSNRKEVSLPPWVHGCVHLSSCLPSCGLQWPCLYLLMAGFFSISGHFLGRKLWSKNCGVCLVACAGFKLTQDNILEYYTFHKRNSKNSLPACLPPPPRKKVRLHGKWIALLHEAPLFYNLIAVIPIAELNFLVHCWSCTNSAKMEPVVYIVLISMALIAIDFFSCLFSDKSQQRREKQPPMSLEWCLSKPVQRTAPMWNR